jgi:hypothetical protein
MKAIFQSSLDKAGSIAIYAEEDGVKQATQALFRRRPHRVVRPRDQGKPRLHRTIPASQLSAGSRPRMRRLCGTRRTGEAKDAILENIILRPNPLTDTRRLWVETRRSPARNSDGAIIVVLMTMERTMKRTLIRYKTKPEAADQNAGLIAKVFEELKAAKPDGLRYLSLRLDDDSFVHFVEAEDGANLLTKLEAFQAFQSGVRERCVELPQAHGVTVVGNYRMLGEP